MPPARCHTLDLRPPEGAAFTLPLAGPATRLVAWLVDLRFTLGALLVVNGVLGVCGVFAGDAALAGVRRNALRRAGPLRARF